MSKLKIYGLNKIEIKSKYKSKLILYPVIKSKLILYPVIKRDILISSSEERALNVLDKTFLHLCYVEPFYENVANTLKDIGINKEMRTAIKETLESKEYIDGYKVTKEGEKVLFNDDNEKYKKLEKAFIFQNPFDEYLIPFYDYKFTYEEKKKKDIKIEIGDEGTSKSIKPLVIDNEIDVNEIKLPNEKLARLTCREYSRMSRSKPPISYLRYLDAGDPEIVYIPLKVFFNNDSIDWMVYDPLNKDISNYWKKKIEDLYKTDESVKNLIDNLTDRITEKEKSIIQKHNLRSISELLKINVDDKQRKTLIQNILNMEKEYKKIADTEKVNLNIFFHITKLNENILGIILDRFSEEIKYIHSDMIGINNKKQIKTLGFNPIHIKDINSNSLNNYKKHKEGNLWVRIAFLLHFKDRITVLKRLSEQFPDWFVWLIEMNKYRNEASHIDLINKEKPDVDYINDSRNKLVKTMEILLELEYPKGKINEVISDPNDNKKEREAKNRVRPTYKGKDKDFIKLLRKMEHSENNVKGRLVIEYLMKELVRKYIGDKDFTELIEIGNEKGKWRREVKEIKNTYELDIPKGILEAGKKNIPKNIDEIDKMTIGGLAVAFILIKDQLEKIKQYYPNFFKDIFFIDENADSHHSEKTGIENNEYKKKVYEIVNEVESIYNLEN